MVSTIDHECISQWNGTATAVQKIMSSIKLVAASNGKGIITQRTIESIPLRKHIHILMLVRGYHCWICAIIIGLWLNKERRTVEFYSSIPVLWSCLCTNAAVQAESVPERIEPPFNERTMMDLDRARVMFLCDPNGQLEQWARIWAKLKTLTKENKLAWAAKWMTDSVTEASIYMGSLAAPYMRNIAFYFRAPTHGNFDRVHENILELCRRMPKELQVQFLTSADFFSGQVPIGPLLECQKTKNGTGELLLALDEDSLTEVLSRSDAANAITASEIVCEKILKRVEGFSQENQDKIHRTKFPHIRENRNQSELQILESNLANLDRTVTNDKNHHSNTSNLMRIKSSSLEGNILAMETSLFQENESRSRGIELLEQANNPLEMVKIAQLFLAYLGSGTGEDRAKALWRGAGIGTMRFLIRLLNGNQNQRTLGKNLLKSIPAEIFIVPLMAGSGGNEDKAGQLMQSCAKELLQLLPDDRQMEIANAGLGQLLPFLETLDSLPANGAVNPTEDALRSRLPGAAAILRGDGRRQLLRALLHLFPASWERLIGESAQNLYAKFKIAAEPSIAEDEDLMRALQARCCDYVPDQKNVPDLLKILKSRSPSPADDGWNNAYKDFATACEDLEKALLHHLYSNLTRSTRQSLVEMAQWVAGSFPLVSADTMKRLTKLCAQTQSYTTSCADALRTGKEFFEGSWALERSPNVDIEQKAQIVVDLWLQTCVNELVPHLGYSFRNRSGVSNWEHVEIALLIRRLLSQFGEGKAGGIWTVGEIQFTTIGINDLNSFSDAILQYNFEDFTKPSASQNPKMIGCMTLIELCLENFPNATNHWLNFPEMTLEVENDNGKLRKKLKIIPLMLCLLYWCKCHSLDHAMQSNTGWARALVPDIAHIPLSTYQMPLSIENKPETPEECFLNLLKELNPLVNKCAVPLEGKAQNAFLEIKEKLQQLLQNPTQISCGQAVDFLNCLYYGASEQKLAPDPTDKVPSSSEGKALPLSDVGLKRFYALLKTIQKVSFEDDIKKISMDNLKMYCYAILVKYHLLDELPAVPVPPAVLPT